MSVLEATPSVQAPTVAPARRYFSKSLFAKAATCPSKLNYVGRAPFVDATQDDEFLRTLAEGGHQIGALGRFIHGGGTLVAERDSDAALARTSALLASQRNCTLYEPALSDGRLFARIDILRDVGEEIHLIEVKSVSYDPNDPNYFRGKRGGIRAEVLPYVRDLAFQVLVARRALPGRTIRPFLLLPDVTRVASVDGVARMFGLDGSGELRATARAGLTPAALGDHLLTAVDMSEVIDSFLAEPVTYDDQTASFEAWCDRWAQAWQAGSLIDSTPSSACRTCEFRASAGSPGACAVTECWSRSLGLPARDLVRGELVIDIADSRRADDWLEQGKVFKRQLSALDLMPKPTKKQALRLQCDTAALLEASFAAAKQTRIDSDDQALTLRQRQWAQASGAGLSNGYVFQTRHAAQQMSQWRYPLNLIDFETARLALPMRKGQRPYGLTVFQFSHHLMHENGRIEHAGEFLCTDPAVDTNRAFLAALKATLALNEGSVMMWSNYEAAVLCELIGELEGQAPSSERDDLIAFAASLVRRTDANGNEQVGARAMIDLCELSFGAFFHRDTHGSNSIKRVLPAMLACNQHLRQRYAQPVYGLRFGNGRNFVDPVAWVSFDERGGVRDPYSLLPPVDLNGVDPSLASGSLSRLQQGGAAIAAYTLLATEGARLGAAGCDALRGALLRYCELDTFAMALVVEGWRAWAGLPTAGATPLPA